MAIGDGVEKLRQRRAREQEQGRAAQARGDISMMLLHARSAAMFTIVILHIMFPAHAAGFYSDVIEKLQ